MQYTFNQLPQGDRHSPAIAHHALAKILNEIKVVDEVNMYQYIDDILIGGDDEEAVREVSRQVWDTLTSLELEITPAKCQAPNQEVKFLGVR